MEQDEEGEIRELRPGKRPRPAEDGDRRDVRGRQAQIDSSGRQRDGASWQHGSSGRAEGQRRSGAHAPSRRAATGGSRLLGSAAVRELLARKPSASQAPAPARRENSWLGDNALEKARRGELKMSARLDRMWEGADGIVDAPAPEPAPRRSKWADDGAEEAAAPVAAEEASKEAAAAFPAARAPPRRAEAPVPSPHARWSAGAAVSEGGLARYEILNRIAAGASGTVFRASERATGDVVALKQVKTDVASSEEGFPVAALRELVAMRELRHPNLLGLRGVVTGRAGAASGPGAVFMVLDYCAHDVRTFQAAIGRDLSEAEAKRVALELLRAVAHMHARRFFHRDLKPSNLLCSETGSLRVADFGLCRRFLLPPSGNTSPRFVVTPTYRSIELLLGDRSYGSAVDVWSCGCIIAELLSGKRLFRARSEAELATTILRVLGAPEEEEWPEWRSLPYAGAMRGLRAIPPAAAADRPARLRAHLALPPSSVSGRGCVSDAGVDLLAALLRPNPAHRLSAADALDHPWFTSAKPRPQLPALMPRVPSTNESASREARADDDGAWAERASAVSARSRLAAD